MLGTAVLLLCTELFHIYSGVNSDPPRAFACGILKALGGCCSSCLHFYSLTAKLREMQLPDCTARARGEGWPAPCVPCCQAEGMCEHCSELMPAFISCTEGVAGPSSCPGQRGVMLAHRPPPKSRHLPQPGRGTWRRPPPQRLCAIHLRAPALRSRHVQPIMRGAPAEQNAPARTEQSCCCPFPSASSSPRMPGGEAARL